jgi:hypothetical protein
MNESVLELAWKSPGPVSSQFMRSTARVQVLNGPVGSGKTTTVFMKAVKLAQQQAPSPKRRIQLHGEPIPRPVRMFKLCVVRDTYRNLWRSTIKSWEKRMPRDIGEWKGAEGGPATHTIPLVLQDGTVVELIVDFIAIGDNSAEDVLRGYEPTAFYLNEADRLHWECYQWARTRWGRYPDIDHGGPTWWGILMDCNAPQIGTPLYERIFLRTPPDVELFRQPSGLAPDAENKSNLAPGYYEEMMAEMEEALIDRMIRNRPGFSLAGKPVHPEFNDLLHVADHTLEPIPGLPLIMGFDAGLDPAAVICQKIGNGRWHVLDEIVSEHGTGAIRFSRHINELLRERYPDWHATPISEPAAWLEPPHRRSRIKIQGWADPAAQWGVDRQEDEQTWIELVSYHTGIRIAPAPTNDRTTRRESLRRVLTLMPDGKPAFVLSPRCEKLRAGLNGGFHYRKMQLSASTEDRWSDEVEKNGFSHVCEALEYAMMGGGEAAEIHERRQRGWDVHRLPRQAVDDLRLPE